MNRYNIGVIGNCSYLAYIDLNANVNWLCMPRFFSSFIFGLFSEDADENFGQWGNFPQTYSHVGLVNAVYRLSTSLDKPIFL